MTKRIDNRFGFKVITNYGVYFVTLLRIKNDVNGNPRFEAAISLISHDPEKTELAIHEYYTVSYRFTGHYCSAYDEAKIIVNRYEMDLQRD